MMIIKGHYDLVATYVNNFNAHKEHCEAPGTVPAHAPRVHSDASHPTTHLVHDSKKQAA
jgi:hypothetical protein